MKLVSKYFRLKFLSGKAIGLPEEISEEVAMTALKEHWNDPNRWLKNGQRLTVNEYTYWKND